MKTKSTDVPATNDAAANTAKPRRGRPHLTEADKAHMALRREEAAKEKQDAKNAIDSNPQFTNPKFWAGIDSDKIDAITDAIGKAGDKVKQAKIAALKAKLAELEAE